MAEQADAPEREDEELELTEVVETPPEGQDTETETEEHELSEGDPPEDELDEFSFGDEAAPASAGNDSDLVRHLRKVNREQAERLSAIERGEIPAQPKPIERKAKPTLEDCEYDADRFETELLAWNETERQATAAEAQVAERTQAEQARFAARLQAYGEGQKALKVRDFEAAEVAVLTGLSQVQQAVVIKAADDPAKLVYALGRHPEKLKTLSAIEDPIEFTKQLVKLEGTLKVTRATRTPPDPDVPVRGSAPLAHGTDKTLERLEKEAERTGDRSAVIAHKRRLKAQGR